jgi:hypothetical protein
MKFSKALIWSAIHHKEHRLLKSYEKEIDGVMPLLIALFPGINYYSISGFYQILGELVRPALRKLFPELVTAQENEVGDEWVEVKEFLPSQGYEWQDQKRWRNKFDELLAS